MTSSQPKKKSSTILNTQMSGSNPREMFKNHFECDFSATLSQVGIHHEDELRWLLAGLTEKLIPLGGVVSSF